MGMLGSAFALPVGFFGFAVGFPSLLLEVYKRGFGVMVYMYLYSYGIGYLLVLRRDRAKGSSWEFLLADCAFRLLGDYRHQKRQGIREPQFHRQQLPELANDLDCWE